MAVVAKKRDTVRCEFKKTFDPATREAVSNHKRLRKRLVLDVRAERAALAEKEFWTIDDIVLFACDYWGVAGKVANLEGRKVCKESKRDKEDKEDKEVDVTYLSFGDAMPAEAAYRAAEGRVKSFGYYHPDEVKSPGKGVGSTRKGVHKVAAVEIALSRPVAEALGVDETRYAARMRFEECSCAEDALNEGETRRTARETIRSWAGSDESLRELMGAEALRRMREKAAAQADAEVRAAAAMGMSIEDLRGALEKWMFDAGVAAYLEGLIERAGLAEDPVDALLGRGMVDEAMACCAVQWLVMRGFRGKMVDLARLRKDVGRALLEYRAIACGEASGAGGEVDELRSHVEGLLDPGNYLVDPGWDKESGEWNVPGNGPRVGQDLLFSLMENLLFFK